MNYRKTALLFALVCALAVFARVADSLFCLDGVTGLYMPGKKTLGIILGVVALVLVIGFAFLVKKSARQVDAAPVTSIPLAIFSLLCGVFSVAEIFTFTNRDVYPAWEVALIFVSSILAIVFYFAFAVTSFSGAQLPTFLCVLPFIYAAVNSIKTFAAVSSTTLISDNVFCVLAGCGMILFMLQFSKTNCGFSDKKVCENLLFYGIIGSSLCLMAGIAPLAKQLFDGSAILHGNIYSLLYLVSSGFFMICYVAAFFGKRKKD